MLLTLKIVSLTILLEHSLNQDEQTAECSPLQSHKWITFAFHVLAASSSCSSGLMPPASIVNSYSFFQCPLTIFSFNRLFLNKTSQSLYFSYSEQTYSCQTKEVRLRKKCSFGISSNTIKGYMYSSPESVLSGHQWKFSSWSHMIPYKKYLVLQHSMAGSSKI